MIARDILRGVVAGAAGSTFLDITTYVDMVIRARPPSDLPRKMVTAFAQMVGGGEIDENRQTGLGALLGYADGLGMAALFGVLRPATRDPSWFWAGIALAALTMIVSEGTATAMKQTDPRRWGLSGWIADIVPRCAYGWVTAVTYDRLAAAW